MHSDMVEVVVLEAAAIECISSESFSEALSFRSRTFLPQLSKNLISELRLSPLEEGVSWWALFT